MNEKKNGNFIETPKIKIQRNDKMNEKCHLYVLHLAANSILHLYFEASSRHFRVMTVSITSTFSQSESLFFDFLVLTKHLRTVPRQILSSRSPLTTRPARVHKSPPHQYLLLSSKASQFFCLYLPHLESFSTTQIS